MCDLLVLKIVYITRSNGNLRGETRIENVLGSKGTDKFRVMFNQLVFPNCFTKYQVKQIQKVAWVHEQKCNVQHWS